MYDDLKDQVVLVTGSSRGIGATIAVAFARAGARVVLHGRDEQALATVRARVEELGAPVLTVTGDVTRAADLDRMRADITGGDSPAAGPRGDPRRRPPRPPPSH